MKQLLIINTHSFVDVITNSSSELFVCNKEKSLDTVKKVLEEKWAEFIKSHPNQYDYEGDDGKRVVVANKESVWDVLHVRQGPSEHEQEVIDGKSEWGGWGYESHLKKDTILIQSNDDNSIPFDFFDVIEDVFDCDRVHLG
jgi:hypothetical protein